MNPPAAAATFNVNVAVCSLDPSVLPRIVTVALPNVADPVAVNVTTDVLPVVIDGWNVAVTPVGSPVADNDT